MILAKPLAQCLGFGRWFYRFWLPQALVEPSSSASSSFYLSVNDEVFGVEVYQEDSGRPTVFLTHRPCSVLQASDTKHLRAVHRGQFSPPSDTSAHEIYLLTVQSMHTEMTDTTVDHLCTSVGAFFHSASF